MNMQRHTESNLMRVVTGNKYPRDRWIVVDDNDNVIFDPGRMSWDAGQKSIKLCNVYVNMPEHREELQDVYGVKS